MPWASVMESDIILHQRPAGLHTAMSTRSMVLPFQAHNQILFLQHGTRNGISYSLVKDRERSL